MIVSASNQKEWEALAQFLNFHARVAPSTDLKLIGWVRENKLVMVVGFNGFMGKLCSIHIASAPEFHYTPKAMLREVFNYAFNTANRELVIGVLNSTNNAAVKYDEHLGFKEMWRIPNMHDDGGDVVVFGMHKHECGYLENTSEVSLPSAEQEQSATIN